MKSYFEIQVSSASLAASLGAVPGPAGADPRSQSQGRLPGPAGSDVWKPSKSRLLNETIAGGAITLELDSANKTWRIKPPAFAYWNYYLSSTQGKWERAGDEIAICDGINKKVCFSLRQASKMSGHASYELLTESRCPMRALWRRVPKPLPVASDLPIWYGLAIDDNGRLAPGPRRAVAVVVSANRWFAFSMPWPTAGSFRGYGWRAAFVLLTGYLDRGDLVAHPGGAIDYELSLGSHWQERAGPLGPAANFTLEDLTQFALRNAEMLRGLGMAAAQETCIDYDEKHVIIGDLFGTGIHAGIYAHTGECVPFDTSALTTTE